MILNTLEASAMHGTELVQQILLFARGGEGQRSDTRIGNLLKELGAVLKTAVRRSIELTLEFDNDLWLVSADATQIKQVLMNLCMNARDAMPKGGRVNISASNLHVSSGALHGFHGEIPAGSYIRLSVADNGTGIPPEVLEKIFDPFFTTKEVGKGTGLGLSTIAGIVRNHEGFIQVESEPGKGTTFHIYLPAIDAPAMASKQLATDDSPAGQGEVVLVIDDDEGIRYIAEKILEAHGYEVRVAADGKSGLKEFRKYADRIQVVICDHMMPGMSGAVVLEQIHRQAPEVKLISMSGYQETASAPTDGSNPCSVLLPKPLKSETLLRTVRSVIDGVKV
jgi:CheY-like chemotaxis protein